MMCTAEYRTIITTIKDQNQNPAALDSFKVLNTETEEDVTIALSAVELENALQSGAYPITSDGNIDKNQELNLQFIGYINNVEVVNSMYRVESDCCHVYLTSGELLLTLE